MRFLVKPKKSLIRLLVRGVIGWNGSVWQRNSSNGFTEK